VYEAAARAHFVRRIGNDHFFDNKKQAFHTLYHCHLDHEICETCNAQIFEECR
jgi:hypothetical protein